MGRSWGQGTATVFNRELRRGRAARSSVRGGEERLFSRGGPPHPSSRRRRRLPRGTGLRLHLNHTGEEGDTRKQDCHSLMRTGLSRAPGGQASVNLCSLPARVGCGMALKGHLANALVDSSRNAYGSTLGRKSPWLL